MPDVTPADLLAAWEMLEPGERPEGMAYHFCEFAEPLGDDRWHHVSDASAHDRLLMAGTLALMRSGWRFEYINGQWDWWKHPHVLRDDDPFRAMLLALRAERGVGQ